jgi:peroxiredoxin
MMQLHHDFDKFRERDTIVVAVGPENADSFKKYWEKNNLPFYGLPDENHTVLKHYGQEFKLLKLGRMPAQMIVDKKGILRYVHYGQSMEDIPSNEELFQLLDGLQAEEGS